MRIHGIMENMHSWVTTYRVASSESCALAIGEREIARDGWQQRRQGKTGGGMVQVGHC